LLWSAKPKSALVTGGSRGIGRGIALKLAEDGVNIGIHYYRNEAAAKDTLEEVRKRGSGGFLVQADVCRVEEITRMFAEVKANFGSLDIFVSNARPEASEFFQGPMDITLRQWGAAFEQPARSGAGPDPDLAPARLDADGTPRDIGDVVSLFCREEAGWITGQTIYADGGASLMTPEVPP
jgi:NAD(P)-dependent dehydrogenase (short-subunit alcohol dehydrogenase family)